ncbi:MAG: GTP cyclohydrolase I FolE2 [Moraxellaceae bacterium]|nr:GTP cyclohydrolase I FolE2 [Pseudobdellovibrionaceae bacterium]
MKNDKQDIKSDEQSLVHSNYRGINWVGMSKIQSFITEGNHQIPMELDLFVNLKSGYRGIHMSRLYQLQMKSILGKKVSLHQLQDVLIQAIASQEGLSSQAKMRLKYQTLIHTKSLKSGIEGFRSYPVEITAEADQKNLTKLVIQFVVTYSSTCPQSAKLSKEYFKNQKLSPTELQHWYESEQIFPATPHAQRSTMMVELEIHPGAEFEISKWIEKIEGCLETPVQTAVKKADEMEFARLNAANTMFCEDAVRKVAALLDSDSSIQDYKLTAEHLESLHPHNATSQMSKNS